MRNRGVRKRDEPDSRAWVARKDQMGIAVNTHPIVRMEVAAKAGSTMDERAFVGSGKRVLMKVHTCGDAQPQGCPSFHPLGACVEVEDFKRGPDTGTERPCGRLAGQVDRQCVLGLLAAPTPPAGMPKRAMRQSRTHKSTLCSAKVRVRLEES